MKMNAFIPIRSHHRTFVMGHGGIDRWSRKISVLFLAMVIFTHLPGMAAFAQTEVTAAVIPGIDTLNLALNPAQYHLNGLAKRLKKQRKTYGTIGIGLGVAAVGGGIALLSDSDENDLFQINRSLGTMYVIEGGILILASSIPLTSYTPTERKWREIQTIANPAEREQAAAEALQRVAKKARNNRYMNAVIGLGFSAYYLSSSNKDAVLAGWVYAGLSIVELMIPSRQEIVLSRYLEETGQKDDNRLSWDVGLLPSGGGVLNARLRF